MKKVIIALVNSDEGFFDINNICYLSRWTTNALGMDVDCLELRFRVLNGINFGFDFNNTTIKSRDYDGIISEVEQLITAYIELVKERLICDLKAGYRNVVQV